MNDSDQRKLEEAWRKIAGPKSALSLRRLNSASDSSSKRAPVIPKFPEATRNARWFEPPTSPSPERMLEWTESRLALADVIRRLERERGLGIDDLDLSLSHTHGAVIAVAAARDPNAESGAGVDIESARRPISEKAAQRFVQPAERALPLRPIDLWALKEACYKSHPENSGTLVPDYEILGDGIARYSKGGAPRFKTALVQLATSDELLVALARLSSDT